ncbi:jouberin-like isoform X3 [Asterias amurensis]|uniref:jouberin-like isoform X3 n=1 Tax=Asterias amurensis TaxID=7602 RepID=UPI003AB79FA6
MATKGKVKKKIRKSTKTEEEDDDDRPFSPQSGHNSTEDPSKASLDKLLLAAMQQTTEEKNKSGKKKSKKARSQTADAVLESLKQGANLRKDTEDQSILNNTYDGSDSPRFDKNMTNERRRKLPPKKGVENRGFIDDEGKDVERETPKRTKKKKKSETTSIIDSGPLTMQELEDTPKKVRRRKKSVPKQEDDKENEENVQSRTEDEMDGREPGKETGDEDVGGGAGKTIKGKKKKKKASDDDNLEGEEANEDAEGTKKKKKKKQKKPIQDDGRVFGVTVHRSDRLKTDLYIAHPLVRVHIIDSDTGTYVKKSKLDRAVTSYYENQNAKVDYILPVLTQPFDFKKRKSMIPCWNEQVIFNESYLYLIQTEETYPKVIVFFELLDFVSMNVAATKTKALKGEGGWHRIAWGFLKVVGANGTPNTDKKVRLQLFHPPFSYKAKPGQLDVYQWWMNTTRHPYPSTLYITVKAVKTPDQVQPAVRSLFATQEEQGKMTYNELKQSINWGNKQGIGKKKAPTNWSRLQGQMCRIPNKLSLTLAGDKKGCLVIKFSPSGRFLACGCKDREGYPIIVYEIPSGRFKCKFPGHYSLIYDLCWGANDNVVLSASSDGTARIWNLDTPDSAAEKVFPHPAFVYTAKFHPQADHLVVSGGYDHVLRVWNTKNDAQTGELLQELDGHKGFVNCLCFSRDGKAMYSGDSTGVIIKWNASVMVKAATSGSPDQWSLEKLIKEKELEGVTINSLKVHPSGRRLLIHGRDNNLRMIDLRLYTIMQRYLGALNFREHIRSTMTECGSFVVSGSEDCQAYVWNTDTGDQIAVYSSLGYKFPVTDVDYHPHEHMVAFCSRGEGHPIQVYVYDVKVAQLDVGLKTTTTVDAKDKQELLAGTAKSEKSLLGLLEAKRELKEELDTSKTLRMERVKAKLATVMALKQLAKDKQDRQGTPYQQQQETMLGSSFAFTPGGTTPMHQPTISTWGSTFDTTQYKKQPQGPQMPTPTPAQLESPGVISFLATRSAKGVRSLGMSMNGTGWTPPTAYFPRASTPSIALQASKGGTANFTFNPPASQKKSTDHRRVVALYDYTSQRSDELNLCQGDWIVVLHEDNENWWMGQLENGQQGYFPANYVTEEHLQEDNPEDRGSYSEMWEEGVDEMDGDTTPRRKTKTKKGKKMTAVVSQSGQLKILSAPEDSETDLTPATSQRKKKRKPLARELALDMSENTDEADTPRRRRLRTRSNSAQRKLPSSVDGSDVGIPPKPRKKRSKSTEGLLSNDETVVGSRSAPRLAKTSSRERLLDQEEGVEGRSPRDKKGGKRKQKTNHTERTV